MFWNDEINNIESKILVLLNCISYGKILPASFANVNEYIF